MRKLKNGIYCNFIADIFTKPLHLYFLSSSLSNIYNFCANLQISLVAMATEMLIIGKNSFFPIQVSSLGPAGLWFQFFNTISRHKSKLLRKLFLAY